MCDNNIQVRDKPRTTFSGLMNLCHTICCTCKPTNNETRRFHKMKLQINITISSVWCKGKEATATWCSFHLLKYSHLSISKHLIEAENLQGLRELGETICRNKDLWSYISWGENVELALRLDVEKYCCLLCQLRIHKKRSFLSLLNRQKNLFNSQSPI